MLFLQIFIYELNTLSWGFFVFFFKERTFQSPEMRYWSAVREKKYVHTNGITTELLYFSHTQSFLHWQVSGIHAIVVYWHQHLGEVSGTVTCRSIQKSSAWEPRGTVHTNPPQSENEIQRAQLVPCAQHGLWCPCCARAGWDHSGHMCFSSSTKAHQALPFALFRAAHVLLLSHWSSHSLDCKKITNNGFAVFCFTTH